MENLIVNTVYIKNDLERKKTADSNRRRVKRLTEYKNEVSKKEYNYAVKLFQKIQVLGAIVDNDVNDNENYNDCDFDLMDEVIARSKEFERLIVKNKFNLIYS